MPSISLIAPEPGSLHHEGEPIRFASEVEAAGFVVTGVEYWAEPVLIAHFFDGRARTRNAEGAARSFVEDGAVVVHARQGEARTVRFSGRTATSSADPSTRTFS